MNKYNFLDYSITGAYNNMYAIEPEISQDFYNKEFIGHPTHRESSTIQELIEVHKGTQQEISRTYETIKDFYKDKFPLGSDNHLSGGIHFHLFNGNYMSISGRDLRYKLYNLPLFGKINNQKLYLRSTYRFSIFNNDVLTNSKSTAFCYKTNYLSHGREGVKINGKSSFEFRCNNVFDARMYGYYVGIVIATKEGIELKKTSDSLREYIESGSRELFTELGPDIKLSNINGHRITNDDFSVMSMNLLTIIKLLESHSLVNCALALKEYANEIGFDIQYDICLKDSYTGQRYNGKMSVDKIRLFRIDYKDLLFNNEENFFSFVKDKLKEKLFTAGVDKSLIIISDEIIKKKYSKYITIKEPIVLEPNIIEQIQFDLFDNGEEGVAEQLLSMVR